MLYYYFLFERRPPQKYETLELGYLLLLKWLLFIANGVLYVYICSVIDLLNTRPVVLADLAEWNPYW